jgi:hypothetical protein
VPGDREVLAVRRRMALPVYRVPVLRRFAMNAKELLAAIEKYAAHRAAAETAFSARAIERHGSAAAALMTEIRTAVETSAAAIDAVRALCNGYTPEPPPIFRGPGLSERGVGWNAGTKTLADAVLATIDDTLNGDDR